MTGYQKYRGIQVEGASPLGLILLTYDALIKSLALARMAGDTKDMGAEAHHLSRALEALMELSTSLNMEGGGKIATSLASLYSYMSRRILEGHGADIGASIDEVLSLASSLRDGWQELADIDTGRSKLRQVAC